MGTSDDSSDGPSPDHEFNQALTDLIQTALAEGVDVRGGWSVAVEHREHDYGIEIYRVDGSED